jgi:hypothetical protein
MRIGCTLPLVALLLAGCNPFTQPTCKPGTLNLHVALRLDALAADTVVVQSTSPPLTVKRSRNPAANDQGELDVVVAFPDGYPTNQLLELTVTAWAMGQPVASSIAQIHLQPGCTEGGISLFDSLFGPQVDAGSD